MQHKRNLKNLSGLEESTITKQLNYNRNLIIKFQVFKKIWKTKNKSLNNLLRNHKMIFSH